MSIPKGISRVLMGIWFVVTGAAVLIHLTFEAFAIIMALLAIAIGLLLLFGY